MRAVIGRWLIRLGSLMVTSGPNLTQKSPPSPGDIIQAMGRLGYTAPYKSLGHRQSALPVHAMASDRALLIAIEGAGDTVIAIHLSERGVSPAVDTDGPSAVTSAWLNSFTQGRLG